MYSHEELISAVCAAGRDGKTFTAKDVRAQLGFDSRDKKEQSRFRRRLRAFEKAASEQLEKLGNNSYRLRAGAFEPAAATPAPAEPPAAEVQLDPAGSVLQGVQPANAPLPVEPEASVAPAAPLPQPHQTTQTAQTKDQSASRPKRALSAATSLLSGALALSAAMSGEVRERGRSLREQLSSCAYSARAGTRAVTRLRGWVDSARPLSRELREQLGALRQRVLSSRRRAA